MGAFLGAGFALARSFSQGLRVSARYLEQMHCHVSGTLTLPLSPDGKHVLESNVEALRRLQIYFDSARTQELANSEEENKLLLLVEGYGPHYTPFLIDLLAKRGRRVLTLDVNFNHPEDASPGLLQYLSGELKEPPIQKGENGDWISAGGETPFASELIASVAFHKLIEELKPKYDWILAVSRASSASVEAESLVPLFPFVALTLEQETIEELNFYMKFLKAHPKHKLTFILTSED